MKRFWQAVFILSGMIIGAGMFGIPFSFARAGFWLGTLELAVLTSVVLVFHVLYAELVLATPDFHRMPGYMGRFLGRWASMVSGWSAFFGISGSLLVYVLLGATFLQTIVGGYFFGEFGWVIGMVIMGAVITRFSLKKETLVNSILTVLLVGFIIFIVTLLIPKIEFIHIGGFFLKEVFAPYGVLLFALSGGVVIPDVVTYLGRDRTRVRRAVVVGTVLPAVLYFLFAFVVVGVSGGLVSPEAITGLQVIAGDFVVRIGSIIGFLAVITSFVVLSSSFQALFSLDFGIPRVVSWGAVSLIPLVLYVFGFTDFISVIGAVGAVAIGIDSALVVASYHMLKRREGHRFSWFSYVWKFLIFFMIAAGVIYELYTFFRTA